MAAEPGWSYERVASGADANGQTCIFCGKRIINEPQAAQWTRKAEEDNADADYVLEDGYAHWECSEKRRAEGRRSRLAIPDLPDLPARPKG